MNITDRLQNETRIIKARITKKKGIECDSQITIDDSFDIIFLHRIKNIMHTANNHNHSISDVISEIDELLNIKFNQR